ncbi:cyclic nucleotide-binding domain-containing protein [Proteobacteria bacterium 005FR1]|nr:cyclic nucleotide-binding domain-containing protein [Proteobacteria bacterium 005FR1]
MEIKQISQFPRATVEQLLAAIPFYKTVKQQDLWQFEVLLQHSRVVNFAPGELVLKCGEVDTWLYFLVKGQLAVFVGEDIADAEAINYITPGEVFGDLAMLVGDQRTATLVADSNCRQIMAFATDFRVFGELDDFRTIKLATKLIYYRNTVHNLRWKLEVYRMKYPGYELANDHHKVKLYKGRPGTAEELHSLHQQAVQLARLLVSWNHQFGMLSFPTGTAPNPQLLASVE